LTNTVALHSGLALQDGIRLVSSDTPVGLVKNLFSRNEFDGMLINLPAAMSDFFPPLGTDFESHNFEGINRVGPKNLQFA
jgi:hypothetical protein